MRNEQGWVGVSVLFLCFCYKCPSPLPQLLSYFCGQLCPLRANDYRQRNNEQCAVVLPYDDAINVELDNTILALDSVQLRGTFYLIGSSPVVTYRLLRIALGRPAWYII